MRLIVPLFLLIVGVGFLAAELPLDQRSLADANRQVVEISSDWRRTDAGWRRVSTWTEPSGVESPALHPAVVASFQVLLVLTVSLALDMGKTRGEN